MKSANDDIKSKVRKTQNFYDTYPLSDGDFRGRKSVLSREDIQVKPEELDGKTILDCGCGPGNVSLYIASSVKNAHLVSMDISKNSLEILKERLKKVKSTTTTEQVLGNVLDIEFDKESFDFIVCSGVVHHTPKPFKALDNLAHVLKTRGKMYLSIYNRNSFYFPEFYTIGQIFRFLHKYKMQRLLNFFMALFGFALTSISGENVSREHAQRIFADRYLTPVASFHTNEQVREWCNKNGIKIIKNGTLKFGTLIWFLTEKG